MKHHPVTRKLLTAGYDVRPVPLPFVRDVRGPRGEIYGLLTALDAHVTLLGGDPGDRVPPFTEVPL